MLTGMSCTAPSAQSLACLELLDDLSLESECIFKLKSLLVLLVHQTGTCIYA